MERIKLTRTEKINRWVHGVTFLLYTNHALGSWRNRMWMFASGLYFIKISPGSLQLTAIYGLTSGFAILLFGAVVGDWIDRNARWKAAAVTLFLQTGNFALCAFVLAIFLWFQAEVTLLFNGGLVTLCHVIIILLAVLAQLSVMGNTIVVQRDWLMEICLGDHDVLATMSATLRRIDLGTKLVAPVITGLIMTHTSTPISAIVLAVWNLVSTGFEYLLLKKIYNRVPGLAVKQTAADELRLSVAMTQDGQNTGQQLISGDEDPVKEPRESDVINGDGDKEADAEIDTAVHPPKEEVYRRTTKYISRNADENVTLSEIHFPGETVAQDQKQTKANLSCRKILFRLLWNFVILYKGWRTYMNYRVAIAGVSLAFLYMTVLGFHNVTTAYAFTQGMDESLLGILMSCGGLGGIIGTIVYPRIRRRVGLVRTGLYSMTWEVVCLVLCVVSVWTPGGPFSTSMHNSNCTVVQDVTGQLGENISQKLPLISYHAGNTTAEQWSPSDSGAITQSYKTRSINDSESDTTMMDNGVTQSSSYGPNREACPQKISLALTLLMSGIISARLGVWISDLTITQLILENVRQNERGVVNGVQDSLNMLMELLKYGLVVILPRPEQFGYLVLISFAMICTAAILYAVYARKVRGHVLPHCQ